MMRSRAARVVAALALVLATSCQTEPVPIIPNSAQGFVLPAELAQRRAALYAQLARVDRELQAIMSPPPADDAPRRHIAQVGAQLANLARFSLQKERVVASRKFDADRELGDFLRALYDEAQELLDATDQMVGNPDPPSLSCRTEISGEPDGARIHYLPYGEFADQNSTEWRSYDSGAPLDIGLYQFRVSPPDETPYFERVLIMTDPFRTRLRRLDP